METTDKKNCRVKGMEGMNMRMSKENIKEITEYLAEASEHENEDYVAIILGSVSQMIMSEVDYYELNNKPKLFAKEVSNRITRLMKSNESQIELEFYLYLLALAMNEYGYSHFEM